MHSQDIISWAAVLASSSICLTDSSPFHCLVWACCHIHVGNVYGNLKYAIPLFGKNASINNLCNTFAWAAECILFKSTCTKYCFISAISKPCRKISLLTFEYGRYSCMLWFLWNVCMLHILYILHLYFIYCKIHVDLVPWKQVFGKQCFCLKAHK